MESDGRNNKQNLRDISGAGKVLYHLLARPGLSYLEG